MITLDMPSALPATLAPVVVRPAQLGDIEAILALHHEVFADKFGGAFGSHSRTRGIAALAAAWRSQGARALRGMLVAEYQHAIVGTTTLRTWEMGEDDTLTTELAFQRELGVWGALRSLFAFSLLSHRIERREGFITDVAVDTRYRRSGVACTLLQHAEALARQRRKHYLGLYVSSTNTGAISLYQRLGFVRVRTRSSLLTLLFFRQRRWFYMHKALSLVERL